MDIESDQSSDRLVAVGVDGSPESIAAARYGVQAASQRGMDLLLVHAYELPPIHTPIDPALLDACYESARKLVADVAAQLVVPSGMGIETYIKPASPAGLLLQAAEEVALLVVGQDHLTFAERMRFGQVAYQVAQRSHCPVVVVPGGWRASKTASHHPVVVALQEDSAADAALRMAFEEARLLGRGLMALHASPYGSEQQAIADDAANMSERLAAWKRDYPGVSVDSLVVFGDQDANLLQWSKSAAVVVIGRPHRHWWNSWTHSAVGAVLKQTRCPLIVVPPDIPH